MTPGLLSKVLSGEYKSEWDAPADTSDLEPGIVLTLDYTSID